MGGRFCSGLIQSFLQAVQVTLPEIFRIYAGTITGTAELLISDRVAGHLQDFTGYSCDMFIADSVIARLIDQAKLPRFKRHYLPLLFRRMAASHSKRVTAFPFSITGFWSKS